MKKEAIVASLPISKADKVIVGINFAEYKRAVRQNLMGVNSSFDVKVHPEVSILIKTEDCPMPHLPVVYAFDRIRRLAWDGFDFSEATILYPDQVHVLNKKS